MKDTLRGLFVGVGCYALADMTICAVVFQGERPFIRALLSFALGVLLLLAIAAIPD